MTIQKLAEQYQFEEKEKKELEEYLFNQFSESKPEESEEDESFLEKWKEIIDYAGIFSAEQALNRFVCAKRPVTFCEPGQVKIELYQSFSGRIPIIYIKNTSDFEAFLTNTVYRGIRPSGLSETGASFVSGKKTRFIVLSAKPYSNVPAEDIGISEEEWAQKSMIIRREHECTHYYTKCRYGLSRNNLHDEIMADFFGLYEAFGSYKAEYFLRFLGVTGTSGNRMSFYVKGFSGQAVDFFKKISIEAAKNLELWSKTEQFLKISKKDRIDFLCLSGLEKIVSGELL